MTKSATRHSLVDMAYMIQLGSDCDPLLLPCDGETKYPPIKGWQKRATHDLAEFEKLCRGNARATMISVATGPESDIFAVDLDDRHGGRKSWAALIKKHGDAPTNRYKTPNGERHNYKWPAGCTFRNRASDIAPGVDIKGGRADGRVTGQMAVPPSMNAKGGKYEWVTPYCGFHGLAEAPRWLVFLAMFSKRQRKQLAEAGIDGHEGFVGLAPAEWEDRAREILAARKGITANPVHDLDAEAVAKVSNYVESAIANDLALLSKFEEGERDTEANNTAMKIHSLLKGAEELGLDTSALEADAYAKFVETANKLMPDAPTDQWADQKWIGPEPAADPRDLRHVLPTSPDDEFEAIDPPSPADAGSTGTTPEQAVLPAILLEHYGEISLEAMIARQSNALVKGVLHPGESCMIYGDSTAGKTFVGIDLAWHIALGRDWHGRRTKRAPVLYVALEGVENFRKRMLAAGEVHGDPGKWFARFTVHVSLVKSEAGEKGVDKIVEAAELQAKNTGQPVGLIVIDTLARATAGDDENAVADMMAFVEKRAGDLTRRTGAAIMVVHHENAKGNLRGSSSLRGSFDAVLKVERFSPDADTGRRTVAEKVKDDTEGALFDFKLRSVTLGRDSDDLPVTSCVLETSAPTGKKATAKETEGQKALREALEAAVEAGKGMPHPEGRDGPAAPESAVRACFGGVYTRRRVAAKEPEPAEGAIRTALSKALKDLPADICRKDVDGVTCLYVWTPSEPPYSSDPDDEFSVVDEPVSDAEKHPKNRLVTRVTERYPVTRVTLFPDPAKAAESVTRVTRPLGRVTR